MRVSSLIGGWLTCEGVLESSARPREASWLVVTRFLRREPPKMEVPCFGAPPQKKWGPKNGPVSEDAQVGTGPYYYYYYYCYYLRANAPSADPQELRTDSCS